ncbi:MULTISPECIES: fatty acid desaturase [Rhodobacterales]|uniref:fatty acid desaturase n=1 Tax=Rhodobacterales TaxID=204455 RepID=UPI000894CDDC|nr:MULTISPECIES: fatty acid desaturase [Paracoccaceae]MBJ2153024.1 fatty acid desaturase [Paracoccus sp. IB05]SED31896.1 Fatty acid desaturase [Rhodobacter sp. 24-YEA-8]
MDGNGSASYAGIGGIGSNVWPLTGAEMISRSKLKELRARSNGPGLVNLAVHISALAVTGFLVWLASGNLWLQIPAMVLYGTIIVLTFAPLHECSHGTAFRSRWLNYLVGIAIATATLRPFLYFKYRHAAHHTYTQHDDLDPDIVPFPTSLREYFRLVLGASFWPKLLGTLWRGATGRYNEEEKSFLPESVRGRVSLEIRLDVLLYITIAAASVYYGSMIALTYWLIPRFLGEPVLRAIRMAEHTGAEESPDLLANTRTTLANPIFRKLYWNMPFHAEHHLASSVPFHALGQLHDHVQPHLKHVSRGYIQVHREILAEVLRLQREKRQAR